MNKIYKVVWSKAKHCYVVTSELAKRNGKGCGARSLRMAAVTLGVAAVLVGGVGFGTPVAWAGASDNTFTVTSDKAGSVYGGIASNGSDPGTGFRGGWSSNNADEASRNTITISSGTVNGRVFGGSTFSGAASYNKVTVTSGTVSDRVIGGNSSSGAASNNMVTISGGTVEDWVLGGSTYSAAASDNTVTISSGTVSGWVYGGNSGTGEANSNTITVTGGTINSVHGGYSSAIANGNTVTVSGGTVGTSADNYAVVGAGNSGLDDNSVASGNNVTVTGTAQVTGLVIGARDAYGSAVISDNTVTIDGSAVVTGDVIGGYGWGKDKTKNKVYVKGGTVTGDVYGGSQSSYYDYSDTGNVTDNTVTISGGTLTGNAYGGSLRGYITGNVTGNKVSVEGGSVTGDLYGGIREVGEVNGGALTREISGNVTENSVSVSKGTVSGNVFGGYVAGDNVLGNANSNTVEITGGTVSSIYGGYSDKGAVTENEVTIGGGTVTSSVYGGYGFNGDATGNTVTMTAGRVDNSIYGGVSETKATSNNTVTVSGGRVNGIVSGGVSGRNYGTGYPAVGNVTNNVVEISDAVIANTVYGGRVSNATANAEDNQVIIKGTSKVLDNGIIGGETSSGSAIHNIVTIEGGTISGSNEFDYVVGGRVSSGNGESKNNEVHISGGTVIGAWGGFAQGGEASGNKVTVSGGKVTGRVEGAYSLGPVTNNSVTITGGEFINPIAGGDSNTSATGNTVTFAGGTTSWLIYGGSARSSATDNTVTISDGDLTVTQDRARPIYGGYVSNAGAATGNVVNLTGATTGLETRNIIGGYVNGSGSGDVVTGNELHVGGIKGGDVGVWTGSSNNTVNKVANFETIAYHSVNWSTTVAALEATTVENVGSIDINNLAFSGAASSGTMALLKSGSDLSAIKLKYSDSTTGVAITTSGVVISGGGTPTTETDGVNGVKLTSTSSEKVLLAEDKKAINYSKGATTVSGITFGTFDIDATNAARDLTGSSFATGNTVDAAGLTFTDTTKALKKNDSITLVANATGVATAVANGTGKTIGIKGYEDAQKIKYNATASGDVTSAGGAVKYTVNTVTVNSIDLAGWTGTASDLTAGDISSWTGAGVAVSGSFTEPEIEANSTKDIVKGAASGFFTEAGIADAIKYKAGANFTGDAANGVTLAGTQSKGVQAADSGKKLVYAAGAKDVTDVTLGSMVAGTPRTMAAGYGFAGVTTINAGGLQFDKPEDVKADATLLANATGLTAGLAVTGADHSQDFTKTAANSVALTASLKGTVETAANAVNYKYVGTELTKVDLANWNGSDATFDATGWTLAKDAGNAVTATVETDGMNVSGMNPGDEKPVLSVTGVDLTGITVNGEFAYKTGGDSIGETSHASGVTITAGTTTGGGVKVSDSNTSQLIYEQSKKDVTAVTLGSVAYTKDGTARAFDSTYDLTNADITATDFSISNAATATMNAGDTMVIVDATNAIKGTGTATLKEFTKQNAGDAIAFEDKIDETVLTFSGTHQDTLEQNSAKTQIVYKVGDKNVSDVKFDGNVEWNDSEAYYTNDAAKYKFNGAANIDAENLKVTGTTTKLLKADGSSSMTLLSAEGMTAGTVTEQSDANKEASKIAVNYKDGQGVALVAEAKGEVKAEANAVKYNINEVKLTDVDLSGWLGSESSVPETWTAEDGSVKVATGSFAAPEVAAGASKNILTAGGTFFTDDNISGANKYGATAFAFNVTKNNVSVSGKQDKGVQASADGKSLVYAAGMKNADSVSIGAVTWQKDATLLDSGSSEYNYGNVTTINTSKFDVTYDTPETVTAGDSMTLLKANKTLADMAEQAKAKDYSFAPVEGVTVNATLTGNLTAKDGNVTFTAAENKASLLTFGDVEWKNSGALLTRPSNIIFAGADVDTSKINFYNEIYLEADRTMTLVSDFGDSVGTVTGGKYLVGTAFEGEGEASLSGSDLIFTTRTEAGVSEQTHKAVMAEEANMALLKTGNEYVGKMLEGLGDAANMGKDGISTAAAIGGGASRYETGSHVNTRTWNAAVAVGKRSETKKGTIEYGIFGEYGKGNYTLHSDVGRSDGDAHYAGGGLMAKFTNKHDVYTEASFRVGRMSDSADDLLRDGAGNAYGYDVHATYYGAHLGVGKVFKYEKGKSLDVYGKYFYTKRDGVEFDVVQHYNLDSVASSVLRIGARYGTTEKLWNWYGGLAYEYEFDGKAEGTVNNTAIRSASVKGSSVRGELGLRMSATKENPWQTDINLYGYGGKHRGFGGNVYVAYVF